MKEKILVSSCLLGVACRWHGKKQSVSGFIKRLQLTNPDIEFIPVCPEVLGGLPVPRPPVKRRKGKVFQTCEDKAERKNITGAEVTEQFNIGAQKTLNICVKNKCKKAILCKWSPSCDINGITGKLLTSKGIEVINTF